MKVIRIFTKLTAKRCRLETLFKTQKVFEEIELIWDNRKINKKDFKILVHPINLSRNSSLPIKYEPELRLRLALGLVPYKSTTLLIKSMWPNKSYETIFRSIFLHHNYLYSLVRGYVPSLTSLTGGVDYWFDYIYTAETQDELFCI